MSQKKQNNSVQRFNKKLKKSIQKLLNQFKSLIQSQGRWLLRCLLITKKIPQISLSLIKNISNEVKQILGKLLFSTPKTSLYKSKGFILPTIAIVVLVFALVVGSIIFRSANRTEQVVNERQKQIVDTATTPAIQRAKAKIEGLFASGDIARLAPGKDIEKALAKDAVYKLPDETRIDINNDGNLDNAWSFNTDIDGDGTDEKIVYSILTLTPDDNIPNISNTSSNEDKAKNSVVRNLPIAIGGKLPGCDFAINTKSGWYSGASTSNFFRAFQITAVAIKNNENDRSYSALQLQQDRESDLGNKWGAWFLNDLEIFPGPSFNWNGAMHTEGNLIVGNNGNRTRFRGYLVSDPQSCIYNPESNSEVTIAKFEENNTDPNALNGGKAFEGQMLSATVTKNAFNTGSRWDIWSDNGPLQPFDGNNNLGSGANNYYTMNPNYDSVTSGTTPGDRLLEPVQLLTEGIKESRSTTNPDNQQEQDSSWNSSEIVQEGRIFNQNEPTPYVDDTYRADDRYGQKPVYGSGETETKIPSTKKVGDRIETTDFSDPNTFNKLVSNDIPTQTISNTNKLSADSLGFDGYWERRAWAEGLRIIVGQRLELGDRFGWQGDKEALYPPETNPSTSCRANSRCNERRQYKTLLDSLAAVQSTAVYTDYTRDSDPTKREFPVACIASVAHPGTQKTIDDSTTFNYINNSSTIIDTNFFQGQGTNGWEFNPPGNSENQFRNRVNNSNNSLRIALTNLAHFAGDPDGAFPAKQETTGANAIIHPYPYTMMWGDFSNLRRVIDKLDNNTATYRTFNPSNPNPSDDLSIADKTTLQTAACTLGMLAYNIDNVDNGAPLNQLNSFLGSQYNGLSTPLLSNTTPPNTPPDGARDDYKAKITTALQLSDPALYPTQTAAAVVAEQLLQRIELLEQVSRDRLFGFKDTDLASIPSDKRNYTIANQTTPFNYGGNTYSNGDPLDLGFDFSLETGNNYLGFGEPNNRNRERRFIRLALLLRDIIKDTTLQNTPDDVTVAKYPSLYYIFPKQTHDIDGNSTNTVNDEQPSTEEFIVNMTRTITSVDRITDGYQYQPIKSDPQQNNNFSGVETNPRTVDNWVFQCQNTASSPEIPCSTDSGIENKIVDTGGNDKYVALLDKGIFNGREMMAVRTLDIDLNILRRNKASDMTENWLPDSGIVYAFREDAVREDGIARPARTTFSNCDNFSKITTSNACLMDAVGRISTTGTQQDPPVRDDNGISPKPVDGYADPDRRPYGFRLRNGRDLRRCNTPSILEGLSFITDNPTYISADTSDRGFNLHARADNTSSCENTSYSNRIEEFNNLLNSDFSDFYNRGSSGVNPDFARIGDTWRPTTILSDAITVASDVFENGSIDQGLTNSGGTTSFRNMNYPETQPNNISSRFWLREDGKLNNDADDNSSKTLLPIQISRNGYPLYKKNSDTNSIEYGNETGTKRPYRSFSESKTRTEPRSANRINAILISGLIPSRPNQSYGGLHNFPRFIERWRTDLFISGSLLQLNFSTYATAPFDQDSWEPGSPAQNNESIQYYGPPGRRWGYDVGLQYAPAGPVEERFVTSNKNVSEFYRQLPIDDPYVKSLRCASDNDGQIDPTISTQDCSTVNN